MRRIKLVVALGIVMVAMLALSAGPAVADEWNDWDGIDWNDCGDWDGCDDNNLDDGFVEVLWVPEGTAWYDQLCSPDLPEGYWLPGCIFSDPIEEDHFFDEAVFVIDEIDFEDIDCDDIDCDDDEDCDDEDCDDIDDCECDDEWRFHTDDWRRDLD